jgi:hypothetical protein
VKQAIGKHSFIGVKKYLACEYRSTPLKIKRRVVRDLALVAAGLPSPEMQLRQHRYNGSILRNCNVTLQTQAETLSRPATRSGAVPAVES